SARKPPLHRMPLHRKQVRSLHHGQPRLAPARFLILSATTLLGIEDEIRRISHRHFVNRPRNRLEYLGFCHSLRGGCTPARKRAVGGLAGFEPAISWVPGATAHSLPSHADYPDAPSLMSASRPRYPTLHRSP